MSVHRISWPDENLRKENISPRALRHGILPKPLQTIKYLHLKIDLIFLPLAAYLILKSWPSNTELPKYVFLNFNTLKKHVSSCIVINSAMEGNKIINDV